MLIFRNLAFNTEQKKPAKAGFNGNVIKFSRFDRLQAESLVSHPFSQSF